MRAAAIFLGFGWGLCGGYLAASLGVTWLAINLVALAAFSYSLWKQWPERPR
jgi:hypothetical protein